MTATDFATEFTDFTKACITLKVPRTGIAEVDAVIREALRVEDARAALQGLAASSTVRGTNQQLANVAFSLADAMAQARGAK